MNKKLTQILAILCMLVLLASSAFAADIRLTVPAHTDDGAATEYYGSSPITIEWTPEDSAGLTCGADTDAVTIQYSDDGGLSWTDITTTATVNDYGYDWDISSIADGDEYQIRLVSTCNTPDDVSASFTIDQTAPVADIADVTIDEGDDVTLDASLSSDATSPLISYTYTIEGVAYTGGAQTTDTLDLTWDELDADYGVSNDGTYTIEVEVEDAAGNTHTDTATLTVDNVLPTIEITYPVGGEELTGTVVVEFTIDDVVDTTFSYDLYYEDITGASGLVVIDSDAVTSTGTYTVSWDTTGLDSDDVELFLEVDDGTDTEDYTSGSFLVDNTAPTVIISAPTSVDEGTSLSLTFSATDSGSGFDDQTDSFEIDWGDGTTSDLTDVMSGSHTYAEDGTYTISVTATDDVGLSTTQTTSVTITNAAPVIDSLTCTATIDEGDSIDLSAAFSDAGSEDLHDVDIDWDDTTTSSYSTTLGEYTYDESHTYDEDGSYTVTVTVTDDEGDFDSTTCSVTVNNVAPTVDITAPVDGEYLAGDVDIEWDTTDVGIEDDVDMEVYYAEATAATVCGDSADWTSVDSFTQTAPVDGSFDASWDTTAVADGEYDLCVLVTDDDGDSSEDFVRSVVVDNTAPDAYGPEVSSDHFRSDNYVYFTVSAYDAETGIASAVVEIYDEDGALVATESMDASDGVFEDDLFEGLQAWVMIDSATFADGVYTYMFWVEDLSGNRNADESASDLVIGTFIVDATAEDPRYTNDEIDSLLDAIESDIDALETRMTDAESDVDDLETDLAAAEAEISDLQSDLSDAQADIDSLESDMATAQDDIDALETDLAAAESDIADNAADIVTLQTSLSTLNTTSADHETRITDLESDLTTLEDDVTTLESDLSLVESDLDSVEADLSSLITEFTAYTGFTISQTSDTSDADGSYSVTVTTSSSAVCTITNAVDSSETTTTSAGTTHSLSVTDADLGMQIYTVTCTESTYGWTKESTAYVNVVGFYNLFIADGGNDGFLARVQSFIVSYAELVAAGLTSFDVDSVLTSTDGPSDMALDTSNDVDMLWAYNGTTWSSYNVTNSSGDFAGFNATDVPVYYWMTLEDSAAGKAIIH